MTKLVRPLPEIYRISSDFNLAGREHPVFGYVRPHKGVDIAAPEGTNIRSAGNGIVIWTGDNGKNSFGNTAIVAYPDGKLSLYAHMSKINVKSGDIVKTGDSIGKVGHTGASSGNHLHYEVIDGGQMVNGKPLIKNIIKHNFDIPDINGRKATGIPPTIIRENPNKRFNKRYYIWRTMKDDEVRSSHATLEGQKFSYDDLLCPGEDYNCRCWAEEIDDDLLE